MIFRCKVSGNTVEFTQEHDIRDMLQHPQYEVVEEPKVTEVKKETKSKQKAE